MVANKLAKGMAQPPSNPSKEKKKKNHLVGEILPSAQ